MSKVHPQVEALLSRTSGGPGPHEMPLEQARAMLDALDEFAGERESVTGVADRMIPGPEATILAVRVAWSFPAPDWIAADPPFWRSSPAGARR